MINLYNDDCLEVLKTLDNNSIDLVVIDPPYVLKSNGRGNSDFCKSIKNYNNELKESNLKNGFNIEVLDQLVRVMKNINIYIWCSTKQIPMYIDYFVNDLGCIFDILVWNKTNAMPMFNNKYLSDKEYCLYFRKGGYCKPIDYEHAKTVFFQPINIKDKKLYGHPTIKPLNIISNIIENSSKENDLILDCFMGSGTTGVACKLLNRDFIGIELNTEYFNKAKERIENAII